MMALAFTGPISGSFSIIDWSAVLILIFVPGASFAAADLAVVCAFFTDLVTSEEAAAVVAAADVFAAAAVAATDFFAAVAFVAATARGAGAPPTVTKGLIALTALALNPALESSS